MKLPVLRDTDGIYKTHFDSVRRVYVPAPQFPQPHIEETTYVSLGQIQARHRKAEIELTDKGPTKNTKVATEVPPDEFERRWAAVQAARNPHLEENVITLLGVYTTTHTHAARKLLEDKLALLKAVDAAKAQPYYDILKEISNEPSETSV